MAKNIAKQVIAMTGILWAGMSPVAAQKISTAELTGRWAVQQVIMEDPSDSAFGEHIDSVMNGLMGTVIEIGTNQTLTIRSSVKPLEIERVHWEWDSTASGMSTIRLQGGEMKIRPDPFPEQFWFGLFQPGLWVRVAKITDTAQLRKAVSLAEEFVRVNGYTREGADTTKLAAEFLYDDGESKTQIAAKRKNTLDPKAFCFFEHEGEWHIGFLSAKINRDKLNAAEEKADLPGKVVIIAKDLTTIKMAHKKPSFSKFKKLEEVEN
jgi:hypothetical protein